MSRFCFECGAKIGEAVTASAQITELEKAKAELAKAELAKAEAELRQQEELASAAAKTRNKTKVTVGLDDDCDYVLIQDAIDDASDGTEIIVMHGFYDEALHINKNIRLRGKNDISRFGMHFSSKNVPIVCCSKFDVIEISSKCSVDGIVFTHDENLTFQKMEDYIENYKNTASFDSVQRNCENRDFHTLIHIKADAEFDSVFVLHSEFIGMAVTKGSAKFTNCAFSQNYADAVWIGEKSSPRFTGCRFTRSCTGIYVCASAQPVIEKSEVRDNSGYGVFATENSIFTYDGSTITKNQGNYQANSVSDKVSLNLENCNASFILNDSASVRAKKGDVSVKVYASATCVFENCNVYFDGYTANESSILSMENCVVSGMMKGEATYKISNCKISRLEFGDNPVCDITDCTGDNAYISLSWSLCEKNAHANLQETANLAAK